MMRRSYGVLILGLAASCAPQPGKAEPKDQAETQDCAQVETELPADVSAAGLAGKYDVRMVAVSGEKSGSSANGRLELVAHDSSMRRLTLPGRNSDTTNTVPVYGKAEIDLSAVGAKHAGDLASLDPTRPGVSVFESSSPSASGSRIILRLGSEANRRDVLRFEGAYTVLRVKQISEGGFAGSWESGAPLPEGGGYFCARKSTGG
jgi:hypothetical protein